MAKLKNVLSGHMSREDVEQIIVMEGQSITYWGDPEGLMKVDKNSTMKETADRLLNSEVEDVDNFNGIRFIFYLEER